MLSYLTGQTVGLLVQQVLPDVSFGQLSAYWSPHIGPEPTFVNRKIEEIRICILFRFIVTGLLPGLPNLSDVVLLASAFTSLSYLWSRVTSLFHDR